MRSHPGRHLLGSTNSFPSFYNATYFFFCLASYVLIFSSKILFLRLISTSRTMLARLQIYIENCGCAKYCVECTEKATICHMSPPTFRSWSPTGKAASNALTVIESFMISFNAVRDFGPTSSHDIVLN